MKISCTLDGIDDALKEIKDYQKNFEKKHTDFLEHLADVGVKAAQDTYGGRGLSITVTKEKTNRGYKILAEGRGVCFVEFGTGVRADASNLDKYYGMTFRVEPGSWSEGEFGKHEWSKWIDSGGNPADWWYNRTAKPGMFQAYQAIVAAIEKEAKEAFK